MITGTLDKCKINFSEQIKFCLSPKSERKVIEMQILQRAKSAVVQCKCTVEHRSVVENAKCDQLIDFVLIYYTHR